MSNASDSSSSLSSNGKRQLAEDLGINLQEYGSLLLSGEDLENRQIQTIIRGNTQADLSRGTKNRGNSFEQYVSPSQMDISEERAAHKSEYSKHGHQSKYNSDSVQFESSPGLVDQPYSQGYTTDGQGNKLARKTYSKFENRGVEPRMSRRYSALLTSEKSTVYGATAKLSNERTRNEKVKSFVLWGIANCLLAVYTFILVAAFWDTKFIKCAEQLDWWLFFYLLIQIAHVVRKLVLIVVWRRAKEPSYAQMKFDIFFVLLVILPEIGMFIWGNTFIYSDDMYACRSSDPRTDRTHVDRLWWLAFAIIVYGYIYMLLAYFICMLGAGFFYTYSSWSSLEQTDDGDSASVLEKNQEPRPSSHFQDNIPYLAQVAQEYRKTHTTHQVSQNNRISAMDYSGVRVSKDNSYQALLYNNNGDSNKADLEGRRQSEEKDYDHCKICKKPFDEGDAYVESSNGHVYHDACAPFLVK